MAPHEGRSALLAVAAAVLAVHAVPPFPGHETRTAVGAVHGGTSSNIVPDRAEMLLETRADDGEVNTEIEARVRRALEGAAATYDATVTVERIGAVTTARADEAAADVVRRAAAATGLEVVVPTAELGVASDDATALMRRVQTRGRGGHLPRDRQRSARGAPHVDVRPRRGRARARRRPARARRARGPHRKSPEACRTWASSAVSAST
jgi:aminobenzoyl-glutamate utilization protein A